VSIAKACSRKATILILDEPTASLDEKGKNTLFDIIRASTRRGLSVIYISHNLGEIFEVCDRVTVFKDGKKVATPR
jgi:ABC-type sugar transport system ATPase subunit